MSCYLGTPSCVMWSFVFVLVRVLRETDPIACVCISEWHLILSNELMKCMEAGKYKFYRVEIQERVVVVIQVQPSSWRHRKINAEISNLKESATGFSLVQEKISILFYSNLQLTRWYPSHAGGQSDSSSLIWMLFLSQNTSQNHLEECLATDELI